MYFLKNEKVIPYAGKKKFLHDVHRLLIGTRYVDQSKGGVIVHNGAESSFVSDVKATQCVDLVLVELKEHVFKKFVEIFSEEDMMCFDIKVIYVFPMLMI